jgi:hypothetical protein
LRNPPRRNAVISRTVYRIRAAKITEKVRHNRTEFPRVGRDESSVQNARRQVCGFNLGQPLHEVIAEQTRLERGKHGNHSEQGQNCRKSASAACLPAKVDERSAQVFGTDKARGPGVTLFFGRIRLAGTLARYLLAAIFTIFRVTMP